MILTPELLVAVKKRLDGLKNGVKLIAFSSDVHGIHGRHAEALASEIAMADPKVSFEAYSIEKNPEKAKQYGIDKAPALIIENKQGRQARFFGLPAGQEFNVFLSGLVDFSNGNTNLPHEILQKAKEISTPMHLQVFVSDTCPYCPGVVKLAHGLAMTNPNIKADMIRVEEFRSLADRHNVMGVPKTIVNGNTSIDGAIPSDLFLRKLVELDKNNR